VSCEGAQIYHHQQEQQQKRQEQQSGAHMDQGWLDYRYTQEQQLHRQELLQQQQQHMGGQYGESLQQDEGERQGGKQQPFAEHRDKGQQHLQVVGERLIARHQQEQLLDQHEACHEVLEQLQEQGNHASHEFWEERRQQWLGVPGKAAGSIVPESAVPTAGVGGEGSMRSYWEQFLFDSRGPSLDDASRVEVP
jgi:hypothetical protein